MNSRWVRGWSPDKGEPRPPLSVTSLSKGFFSLLSPSISMAQFRLICQTQTHPPTVPLCIDPWHIKPSYPHIRTLGGTLMTLPCLALLPSLNIALPYPALTTPYKHPYYLSPSPRFTCLFAEDHHVISFAWDARAGTNSGPYRCVVHFLWCCKGHLQGHVRSQDTERLGPDQGLAKGRVSLELHE